MADVFRPGCVWLIGAGPGDPDLLTRKAERLIAAADVVFHDALVGPGMLNLVSPHVRLVPVGKRSGRHSTDQEAIDVLIVEAALAGERVVRLKGGDPAIFARSVEEIEACRRAGIVVRICPGITAASAAAADLGLSLTLRGVARKLTFATAHPCAGEEADLDWASLADPAATLAIYMGKAAAARISAGLMKAGLAGATPVALVENASLDTRRLFTTRLDLLPIAARTALGSGPALILIGKAIGAVALRDAAPQGAGPDRVLETDADRPAQGVSYSAEAVFRAYFPAHRIATGTAIGAQSGIPAAL